MIDPVAVQMVLGVLTAWLDRREREAVAYLIEENRVLRVSLDPGDCVSPTTIAAGRPLGRTEWALRPCRRSPQIVAPDTLLRWHRQLIARKWT